MRTVLALAVSLMLVLGCGGTEAEDCYRTRSGDRECKVVDGATYVCNADRGTFGIFVKGSCPSSQSCYGGFCITKNPGCVSTLTCHDP